jgi:shikimate kinase
MKVFLLGFMGSGKSYWSRQLSSAMGLPLIELDHEIEQEAGSSIADIFSRKGEAFFRTLERDLLRRLIEKDAFILSCGGGTPCFFDNMDRMNQAGLTLWLNPAVSVMVERLKRNRHHRPLIRDLDDAALTEYVNRILRTRSPFYQKARLSVDPAGLSVDTLIEKIRSCTKLI